MLVEGYNEREKAANYRAALICAVLANIHGKKKYKPEDFMPKEKKEPDDMFKTVEMLNQMLGGTDRR